MQYITFPWEQVGRWLRSLSLSGSTGNTAAWIFYLCAGALPLALMLFLRTRQQAEKCDWLLLLLSAALYTGLWFFANPSYMDVYLTPIPTGGLAKYTLAAVIYSLLLTWGLLRFMARHGQADFHRLLPGLRYLLYLYILVLAAQSFLLCGPELITACRELKEHSSGASDFLLTVSILFLALGTVAELIPWLSELVLLAMGTCFLLYFEKEAFGPGAYPWLQRLKLWSGRLLILILLSNVGFSILQLLCSRFLLSTSHTIVFPLSKIIIVSGIRILSFFYLESKRLKEDNDMFI